MATEAVLSAAPPSPPRVGAFTQEVGLALADEVEGDEAAKRQKKRKQQMRDYALAVEENLLEQHKEFLQSKAKAGEKLMFGTLLKRLKPQISTQLYDALDCIVHWRNMSSHPGGSLPSGDDGMRKVMARIREAGLTVASSPSSSQEAPAAAAAASTSRPTASTSRPTRSSRR